MKSLTGYLCILLFSIAAPLTARSQGEAAVPFMMLSSSPESNGMAGISVAVRRADPITATFSPAQVGLSAFSTGIGGTRYTTETKWLPSYSLSGMRYSAWAMQGGVLLNDFTDLPLRVGVGLAYHRVNFDLGRFATTNSSTGETSYTESYENASGVTVGVGLEYLARAAFGYTFRSINSHLSPIGTEQEKGTGEASAPAKDYSGYLLVPMIDLVEAVASGSMMPPRGLRPFADASVGIAVNGVGDKIIYADPAQADPLPRTARAGIGIAGGLRLDGVDGWEIAGLTWSREAEDLLVVRRSGGAWEYKSGLGDLSFGSNVIAGRFSNNVGLRTGWQLRMGEFYTVRRGTVRSEGWDYTTTGITAQLAGLFKGLVLVMGSEAPDWMLFARDHVDLQYHWSEYSGDATPLSGTRFEAVTLLIRVVPL